MGLLSSFPSTLSGFQILLGCFTLSLCYFIFYALYNLFFSPLANVPGPFFAKISKMPSSYHALKGDRHLWIWQCHQIYGQKFRSAPDEVDFLSAQALRDILGFKSNVQRSKNYEAYQNDRTDISTLTTSDIALHHKKRRVLNLIFTEKSIRAAGVFVEKHVDQWNELLLDGEGKDWSQPRNISEWTDYLVFDIMSDLFFGRSLNIKEPGENQFRFIPKAIHSFLTFMYPVTRLPLLGLLLWLKPRGLDEFLKFISPSNVKAFQKFSEDNVAARCKAEQASEQPSEDGKGERQDMFHFILNAVDPDTGKRAYSQPEMLSETKLLLAAGSDTTAITMSGFFFYIVRMPRVYKKVVEEVRSTFSSAEEIVSGPELSSCKYLRACIDETLRTTPVVPGGLSRTILPGGQTINGEFYPAGVTATTSGWSSGRSDEYGDPHVFRPERWIVDEATGVTAEEVARITTYSRPFSYGWSGCAGKNLAILELLVTLARTLFRLDVRGEPGSTLGEGNPDMAWGRRDKNSFQVSDSFTATRDGPMLQFKKSEV